MARTDRERGRRASPWLGLCALALGSFAAGDTLHRVRAAVEWAHVWWPWLLLVLAVLNLVRSFVAVSSLIAPGVLAGIALVGLAHGHAVSGRVLVNVVLPASVALVGVAMLLPFGGPEQGRWTRFLATGRIHGPGAIGERTRHPRLELRAVAGEIRADLTGSALDGDVTVHITAVAGHVHLTVPRSWPVTVRTTGMVLTRVTDSGPRDAVDADSGGVGLHLLGLGGAVSLVRA
ncbi:hypothetical protein [Actinacidiphila sp. bgisy160]|uniref:hypothetical protein n=1 Tax=Actinacidiphila sp. bgisy160 TaxID=3413796 RepID=UPI003D75ADCD